MTTEQLVNVPGPNGFWGEIIAEDGDFVWVRVHGKRTPYDLPSSIRVHRACLTSGKVSK